MSEGRRQTLLVLRAQCGDRAAFDELLASVQTGLQRYLAGLIGDQHRADDVLQETFVIVWKKLGWLREPEWFRPWIHRIATREAFRRLRRDRDTRESLLAEDDAEVAAAEPAPDLEASTLERLPGLVAGLPPASRAVLLLHYGEGLTLEEAALALDVPLGTVKSRLHYGLAALRRKALRGEREPGRGGPHT